MTIVYHNSLCLLPFDNLLNTQVENSHSDEEVTPKGSKKVEFAEDTKESGSSQEVR